MPTWLVKVAKMSNKIKILCRIRTQNMKYTSVHTGINNWINKYRMTQIFLTEKFQITNIDTASSPEYIGFKWPASKNKIWKEKKSNFRVEKPGKYYLGQVIKVNMMSYQCHVEIVYPWQNGMKRALCLCGILSKMYNPNNEKQQQKATGGYSKKYVASTPQGY